MFSINDGWGTCEAQDILASKLFDKPSSLEKSENKKKKSKNKGGYVNDTADQTVVKTKKSKKQRNLKRDDLQENETSDNVTVENPEKKKKKIKKLKLPDNADDEEIPVDTEKENDIESIDCSPKKKQRKEKLKTNVAENDDDLIQNKNKEKFISVGEEEKSNLVVDNDSNKELAINYFNAESGIKDKRNEKKMKKKEKKKNRKNNNDNNSENRTEENNITESNDDDKPNDNVVDNDIIQGEQEGALATNAEQNTNVKSTTKGNDALSKRRSKFQQKMNRKLEGGHFRYINEKLYTTDSHIAVDMFRRQPSLFDVYHKGFESQVLHWPENPVDLIIEFVKEQSEDSIVVDFGCGNAKVGRSVPQKVHSFDLVAVNDQVTPADMKNVPVKSGTADIAIFSLALMGTNVNDFITEANRVLKIGGHLKIAEVKSRFHDVQKFIDAVMSHGFDLLAKDDANKMFIMFDFEKLSSNNSNKTIPIELKPCIYKRR